jgi:hypothetical protein
MTVPASSSYLSGRKGAALEAVSATNDALGCGTGAAFSNIQCAIAAGAQMTDYAGRGLTASVDFNQACGDLFGYSCALGASNQMRRRSPSMSRLDVGVQRIAN